MAWFAFALQKNGKWKVSEPFDDEQDAVDAVLMDIPEYPWPEVETRYYETTNPYDAYLAFRSEKK